MLIESEDEGLTVKEKPLISADGRINGCRVAIRQGMLTIQKNCVLAEEMGHYRTSTGNILDQQDARNAKQELMARAWAYNRVIGLSGIAAAYEHRCMSLYDMAEYLEVTEDFLQDALSYFTQKFGTGVVYGQYIIYFMPALAIAKIY